MSGETKVIERELFDFGIGVHDSSRGLWEDLYSDQFSITEAPFFHPLFET